MSLSLEQLKLHTRAALHVAANQLIEDLACEPIVAMVLPDGSIIMQTEVFGDVLRAVLNSGKSKDEFFSFVASLAKKDGAVAIVFVSDAWTLDFTDEQKARQVDPKYLREFERLSLEEGVPALAKAGFGSLCEVVNAIGQSKEGFAIESAIYDRIDATGQVIDPLTFYDRKAVPSAPHVIQFREVVSGDSSNAKLLGKQRIHDAFAKAFV